MKTWSAHTPPSKNWKNTIFCIWHPIPVPFFQSWLEIRNELVTVTTYKQWFESYWWAEKKNKCLTSSNWTPDSFKVCLKNFLIMPCKWEGLSNLLSCLMPLMMRLFFLSELSISSILWALFWLFLKWKKKKMLNRSQLSFLMLVVYQMWFKRNFGFGLVDPITKGASSRGAAPPPTSKLAKYFFFGQALKIINFTKYFTSEDLQRCALMNSSSWYFFLKERIFWARIEFKWKGRRHDFKNHFSFIFGANLLMALGL